MSIKQVTENDYINEGREIWNDNDQELADRLSILENEGYASISGSYDQDFYVDTLFVNSAVDTSTIKLSDDTLFEFTSNSIKLNERVSNNLALDLNGNYITSTKITQPSIELAPGTNGVVALGYSQASGVTGSMIVNKLVTFFEEGIILSNGVDSFTSGTGQIDFDDDDLKTTGELTDGTDNISIAEIKESYDNQITDNQKISSISFFIDGLDNEIPTGQAGYLLIPFSCEIDEVSLLADQTGSITIDIWKDVYANYADIDNDDSITNDTGIAISNDVKDQDSTLTDWTTSITANDVLIFNIDSCTNITQCLLTLKVIKS